MRSSTAGGCSNRFTSFDAVVQDRILNRDVHWDPRQCLDSAIACSTLTFPTGRVVLFEVDGFPRPQVILSETARINTHLTVVIVLTGSVSSLIVVDIPTWVTLFDFLSGNRWHFRGLDFMHFLWTAIFFMLPPAFSYAG